jgi:hypothetical protein
MRGTWFIAMLVLGSSPLAAQERVPLVLNHLVITLDSATYHDILAAPFLREQFAAPEIGMLTGVDGGNGVRFFGKYNFLQFFGPKAPPATQPGDVAIVLASEQVGGLEALKAQGRYARAGGATIGGSDGPAHANAYVEHADRLRLISDDSTAPHATFEVMQYTADAARYLASTDSLPVDDRSNSRFLRHNYDPTKLFAYLSGATLAIPVADIATISAAMRRNNVPVTAEGDGAIIRFDGFTLHLMPPWTGAGVKQLQFALTRPLLANPTYRFGPKSELRFGPGAIAVWDFERR